MPPTEPIDGWREAFAEVEGRSTGEDGTDEALVQRALEGELPADELRSLVDRLGREPELAESWRIARRLRAELGQSVSSRRAFSRRMLWVASVAAALVAGVFLVGPGFEGPAPSPYRGPSDPAIESALPAGMGIPREAFELAWSSSIEGASYEVAVLTPELELLYRSAATTGTRSLVPEVALEPVASGGEILWQVEAVGRDGTRLGSPIFRQRVE